MSDLEKGLAADRTSAEKWFQKAREQGFLHTPISSGYVNQYIS